MVDSARRLMWRGWRIADTYRGRPKNTLTREVAMPIAMPKFASVGHLLGFDRTSREPSERRAQLVAQCCACNFEPDLDEPLPAVCPKCHASAWEWFARPDHVEPTERPGHRAILQMPAALRFG